MKNTFAPNIFFVLFLNGLNVFI